jgi:hypothetical protein
MDWGFPSNLPESRLLRLLLLLVLVMAGAWLFASAQGHVIISALELYHTPLVPFSHSIIFTVCGTGY